MDSLLRLFGMIVLIINCSKEIIASSFNDNFYHCKSLYGNSSIKGMGINPGYGWDNLQNLEKGSVASLNYSLCRVTDDELYFIPDDVQIIPLQKTNIEQTAEVFSHWTQYTSMNSKSINVNADMSNPYLSISASFSYDHQYVKSHQVQDDSTTTRVSLTYLHYNILLNPSFQLESKFKNRLLDIAYQLQHKNNQMADYLAELLIRDYGTHVVTSVNAGAILLKEDHIKKRFVENRELTSNSISAAAGVSFKLAVGLQVKFSSKEEQDFVDQYNSNLTATHIRTIGGPYFHINSNVADWEAKLNDYLATIDRQGYPLPICFSTQTIPELSQTMIINLVKVTDKAIQRYYKFNVHAGCTKKKSPNFFFQANIDDGTCEAPYTNFTFGGLYQTCDRRNSYGDDQLCEKFRQVNPLTGSYSCVSGYQNVLLQARLIFHEPITQCTEYCYSWYVLWEKCDRTCKDFQPTSYFETYWCYETKGVKQNSGYLFGGLYTQSVRNPLTQEKSCPPLFIKLNVLTNMVICVSDDFELGFESSLPFGGFFSCKNGNPLIDHNTTSTAWLKGCPEGHSQHLAEVDDGCEIEFCVKMNSLSQDYTFPPIVQPPFTKPATGINNNNGLKLLSTSNHKTLQKSSSDNAWKLTEFNNLMSSDKEPNVELNSQKLGLVLGLSGVAFLALIIGAIYFRKYRKRRANYSALTSSVNSDVETVSETTSILPTH